MKKNNAYLQEVLAILILSLICTLYLFKTNDSPKGIELALADKNEEPKYLKDFIEQRQFTTINLIGEDIHDQFQLKFARNKIREICNSPYSKEGVHFVFSDKSQYWAFIEVLDILQTEKIEHYGLYGNEIWSGNATRW